MALLNFKHGFQAKLTSELTPFAEGTVYIARDERAMYVDLPEYDKGDGSTPDSAKRIRIGDLRVYDYLDDLKKEITSDMTGLNKSALYYAQYDNKTDKNQINALLKWGFNATSNKEEFIQLNKTSDLAANLEALQSLATDNAARIDGIDEVIGDYENYDTNKTIIARLDTLEGSAETTGSVANSIQAAVNSLNGAIGGLNEAIAGKVSTADFNEYKEEVEEYKTEIADIIDGIDEAIGGIDDRIDGIVNTTIPDINEQIADVSADLTKYITDNDKALAEEIDRSTKKDAALEKAIADEADARESAIQGEADARIEAINGLSGRLAPLETFISGVDIGKEEIIDTLAEIIKYIEDDTSGAAEMLAAINKNTDDIATEKSNRESEDAATLLSAKGYTDSKLTWGIF